MCTTYYIKIQFTENSGYTQTERQTVERPKLLIYSLWEQVLAFYLWTGCLWTNRKVESYYSVPKFNGLLFQIEIKYYQPATLSMYLRFWFPVGFKAGMEMKYNLYRT